MRDDTQEKSLIVVNENSIFYKVKKFFRNLFHRNKTIENSIAIENDINDSTEIENNRNTFIESIKNIEDEETKLLKLQKKYRDGEIKEKDLTQEQINSLCDLYDKQIENLKKSNEFRKNRLLKYRKKLQTDS